jgi:SpoIID/LytB domain protein
LEARHGVEIELHDQLVEYPTGELTLSGGGLGAELTHKDVLWAWPSDWSQTFTVKVGGVERAYAGGVIFTVDPEGRLQVINAVPAEKLVRGVVASEVYTSAPMESLKAQSVAARGEVLSYVGARHLGEPYRLCDEVHCQAYKGVGAEHPRTNEAVEATRGEVMVEASSLGEEWRIVDARYSASSGGYSENNENVWRDAPKGYLRGRPDAVGALPVQFEGGITEQNIAAWLASDHPAWSNTQDFGGGNTWRWEKTVEAGVVQAWLDKHFQIGRLREAQVLARGVSGRVIELRFVGDRGEAVLERELAVRRAFGGLRSSMFTMKIDRDAKGYPARFHFRGGGFGHGVGMCQTGAMIMGRTKRYDDILSFYYQGVSLRRVY